MPQPLESVLSQDSRLQCAWLAAERAGSFLRDERPEVLAVEAKSTVTDAVTEMDRGAEALIIEFVRTTFPDDGILGEEGGERTGTSGTRWVVDPLDGTVNYLYALPVWGVSIGVEVDGRTQVGVVVAPELKVGWCALRGSGAWEVRGGTAKRISRGTVTDLGQALVATGFGYDSGRRSRQGAVVAGLLPQVRDIRRVGAAVIDLCWVASGRYDAFFEKGLHPWDFVAGALVAEEAGAVVRGIADVPFTGGLLVSAPGIADELHGHLVELGAHLA